MLILFTMFIFLQQTCKIAVIKLGHKSLLSALFGQEDDAPTFAEG